MYISMNSMRSTVMTWRCMIQSWLCVRNVYKYEQHAFNCAWSIYHALNCACARFKSHDKQWRTFRCTELWCIHTTMLLSQRRSRSRNSGSWLLSQKTWRWWRDECPKLGEYAAPTKQWIAEDSEVRNNQWWRLRKQRSGQRQAGNTFNDLITKVSGQLGFRQSLTTPHLHYNAEEEIGIEVHMVDAHGYGDVSRLPGFHKKLQKLLKIRHFATVDLNIDAVHWGGSWQLWSCLQQWKLAVSHGWCNLSGTFGACVGVGQTYGKMLDLADDLSIDVVHLDGSWQSWSCLQQWRLQHLMAGATSRAHLGHASLLGFKRVQRFCANPRTSLILHFSYHHGKNRLLSVSMLVPRVVVLILPMKSRAIQILYISQNCQSGSVFGRWIP